MASYYQTELSVILISIYFVKEVKQGFKVQSKVTLSK